MLSHDEALAVIDDCLSWLCDECRDALALPLGPERDRRLQELRQREQQLLRDLSNFDERHY